MHNAAIDGTANLTVRYTPGTVTNLSSRSTMKQIVAALAIAAAFNSPSYAAAKPLSADARFTAIYTAEWKWRQQQHLEEEEDDVKGVESGLPHVGAAVQMERQKKWEDTLRQ